MVTEREWDEWVKQYNGMTGQDWAQLQYDQWRSRRCKRLVARLRWPRGAPNHEHIWMSIPGRHMQCMDCGRHVQPWRARVRHRVSSWWWGRRVNRLFRKRDQR